MVKRVYAIVQIKRSLFSSSTQIIEVWATKKAAEAKAKLFRAKVEVVMFPIQHAKEKLYTAEKKGCLTCDSLTYRGDQGLPKPCVICEGLSQWTEKKPEIEPETTNASR